MDPPTAYALSSLIALLGRDLIRAGRRQAAFRAAAGFAIFFAITVQYFLFAWTGWMYSYFFPEDAFSLVWVSPVFFLAVAVAGALGAYVTIELLASGRTAWAFVNLGLGFACWGILWGVTWDPYFHVGTTAEYHLGLARPSAEVAPFQAATLITGILYVIVGIPLAVWVVRTGRRSLRASTVQPDVPETEWRRDLEEALPSPIPAESEGGELRGVRPIDGAPLPPVPITPVVDIPYMVERARAAQKDWASLPLAERRRILGAVKKRFLADAERIAALLEEENGRPRAESYVAEIIPSADVFDFWIAKAPSLLQGRGVPIDPLLFPGKRGVVERMPRGVVGAITPWNFPIALPLRAIVPALIAGNAVILKPSEHSPRAGAYLDELFQHALPWALFQVVQGAGDVGAALIDAGLDYVFFTGSRRSGRAVAEGCARTLTPTALELGAKDAAIVLADADLPRTAAGVLWAAFGNAGQNCASIERCFVVEAVKEPFLRHLEEELRRLRVGPGEEGEVDVGPLSTPLQKEIVERQLAQARSSGAGWLHGREVSGGLHVTPSIVVDPPGDLSIAREETFGPVLPVFTVRDEEEAVRRANQSPYGLTLSVWSRDLRRAEALARRVQAGVITVNNHGFTGGLAQAPWGGVRGSGFGVTNSPEMLEELTTPRFVLVDRGTKPRELWWYPYDRGLLRLSRGIARLRAGGKGRMSSIFDVLVEARRRGKGA